MTYASNAATALRLLTKFGQDVTRRAYSVGTYDVNTNTMTPTTADTVRKGALFDYSLQQAGAALAIGTLIQEGDKQLLLDATGPVELQDHFIIGGVEYTLVNIKVLNPAGTPVLYDLHIRT